MLKQIRWSNVLMSLAYVVAGVLLILYPDVSATAISYIIGCTLIAYGVLAIIAYFIMDVRDTLYNNEFVIGMMTIVFGAAVIIKKELIMDLIPFILGLIIVTSGLVKLHRAIVASRIKYNASMTYAILGVISVILGIVVMFFLSGQTTQKIVFIVIGCGLVYSGLSDLFVQFFLASKFNAFIKSFEEAVKNANSNVVDVPAVEKPAEPTKPEEVKPEPVKPEEVKEEVKEDTEEKPAE